MKANEMPKRIYLLDYNDAMVTPLEGDTVYVREDAFIEKAVLWMKRKSAIRYHLSEELIEQFKKAMRQ